MRDLTIGLLHYFFCIGMACSPWKQSWNTTIRVFCNPLILETRNLRYFEVAYILEAESLTKLDKDGLCKYIYNQFKYIHIYTYVHIHYTHTHTRKNLVYWLSYQLRHSCLTSQCLGSMHGFGSCLWFLANANPGRQWWCSSSWDPTIHAHDWNEFLAPG